MKRTIIVLFLLLLSGCATMSTNKVGSVIDPKIYTIDYDIVFLKAVDSVSQCSWQITFTDKSTGVISAKTSANLLTWGDNVSIRIKKIDKDRVQVDISSGTPNQVVDWGRNSRNINKFFETLDSLLSESKQLIHGK